jgi:hypothetical protein
LEVGVKLVLATLLGLTAGTFLALVAFSLGFSDAFQNARGELIVGLAACVAMLFLAALVLGLWHPGHRWLLAAALALPGVLLALLLVVLSLGQNLSEALIPLAALLAVLVACAAGVSLGAAWRHRRRHGPGVGASQDM